MRNLLLGMILVTSLIEAQEPRGSHGGKFRFSSDEKVIADRDAAEEEKARRFLKNKKGETLLVTGTSASRQLELNAKMVALAKQQNLDYENMPILEQVTFVRDVIRKHKAEFTRNDWSSILTQLYFLESFHKDAVRGTDPDKFSEASRLVLDEIAGQIVQTLDLADGYWTYVPKKNSAQ